MSRLLLLICILLSTVLNGQVEIQQNPVQKQDPVNTPDVKKKKVKSRKKVEPEKTVEINTKPEVNKNRYQSKIINELSQQMILVEGGEFIMGCNHCVDRDNKPEHPVLLNNFLMSKYEITVKQFQEFISVTNYKTTVENEEGGYISMNDGWVQQRGFSWRTDVNGHVRTLETLEEPVIFVSWEDAKAFCAWLSKETNRIFRLPTEAEWEYAAKGGKMSTGQIYAGSGQAELIAWSKANSGNNIKRVGLKKANELGLFDMSGNAWEWCEDWYHKDFYKNSPNQNPKGPSKSKKQKVLRGGSWASDASQLMINTRYSARPKVGAYSIGFRVVAEGE